MLGAASGILGSAKTKIGIIACPPLKKALLEHIYVWQIHQTCLDSADDVGRGECALFASPSRGTPQNSCDACYKGPPSVSSLLPQPAKNRLVVMTVDPRGWARQSPSKLRAAQARQGIFSKISNSPLRRLPPPPPDQMMSICSER
jgi:hypothetical protein